MLAANVLWGAVSAVIGDGLTRRRPPAQADAPE